MYKKIKKGNEKTNKINNNSTAKEEGEIKWLGNKEGKGNGKKSKDDKSDDEKEKKNKKMKPGKGNI